MPFLNFTNRINIICNDENNCDIRIYASSQNNKYYVFQDNLERIKKEVKKDLISKFSNNEKDTGSAEVQIAVLTERINNLIEHFKNHKHDNHSKRGLVALVNNRKKLLSYLSKKDNEKYNKLIKDLKIRG